MMDRERHKQSEKWVGEKAKEWAFADSDLTFAEWCYQEGRKDERAKTINEIEDIVDEINNQGFHCTDDYCDDDNHDCAECMAKAILGSLARMKSNAEYEKEQKNERARID